VSITENYKVCKPVKALYCLYFGVIKSECNRSANKPKHPNWRPSFRHAYHTTRENILVIVITVMIMVIIIFKMLKTITIIATNNIIKTEKIK
jgi:hypothetical protein